ncbi:MAG TPA: DNA mismatch repair endonuclease MutL [Flavobacteriales bacterium]|nr:DNA mismatch repair endonuclease MutL [Flavobacteriales bacterium]
MSDLIRLLPDHVANQIAAGEVVQRPASVVKELLENSVDAGSKQIILVIKDAGRTLIQVTDDGQGMTPTDARTCFERHATSKIRTADELHTVRTKGFRGEALASIAAIAQVEMKTRPAGHELGTRIVIEGSRVQAHEAVACPVGTSLLVRSLFYNVPARRQFLKSDNVEMKHVLEEFQRVALAHPDIRFRLVNNEQELFHLEPGNERQRIVHLLGRRYDERLVPVEEATGFVRVEGFVTKPEFAKRSRGEQYFFVNRRFIRSNYLEHAVRKAYAELIGKESYPGWFLFLELDPAWIDINIHPTKTEIKFRDDQAVYAIVHAAVRRALGRFNLTPSIDFEPEPALLLGATATGAIPGEPPISSGQWRPHDLPVKPSVANWQQMFDLGNEAIGLRSTPAQATLPSMELAPDGPGRRSQDLQHTGSRPVFQMLGRYILAQVKNGFAVIDQQRALERILYEQALSALEQGGGSSQSLLFPVTMELSAPDHALLMSILPEVHALGFLVEPLSGRTVVVNGMPSESAVEDPSLLLGELLEQVHDQGGALKSERHATLARGMARSVLGQPAKVLGSAEMHDLIDRLFACSAPYFSPGGKPILILFGPKELDERFER